MIVTDRSRYKTFFSCPLERYLEYHYLGKGIIYKGTSIPLATGLHSHKAIELILSHHKETKEFPTEELIRTTIAQVTSDYFDEVAATPFLEAEDSARAEFVVLEQTTLIGGLILAWANHILPRFLEEFEVLEVEKEMEKILGCNCGLSGVGEPKIHDKRGCTAVLLMTRPDIIAKKYATNALTYHEVKTGSKIESGTFDGDVQFAFGACGVSGYLETELVESYVHALVKGYRRAGYNTETKEYDLPKVQLSHLCYAYVRAGSPPMLKQDIKYKRGKGVTAAYKKMPVWEIEHADLPKGITSMEHYIVSMPDEELASHVELHGPFPFPAYQVAETMLDVEHVERRNHEVFTYIDALGQEKGFGHEDVQAEMREFVPRSWNCRRFGFSICDYYGVCRRCAGWDEPISMKGFEVRTPNHPIEGEFQV